MSDLQKFESNTTEVSQSMTPVNKDVLDQMMAYGQAWSQAAMLGDQLAKTDFAGPFKGKPADMTVAILKGANLGIPPTDIGKAIYVVHGTPALYGKTALAIALQHGYIAETIEDSPTAVTVRMTSPQGQSMDVRYTIERATTEGLVKGNKLQYETRPSKMLYWKCIGEITDRMIPHLTGGMPVKEDVEQSPVKMTATRKPPVKAKGMDALEAAVNPEPEPVYSNPGVDGETFEKAKAAIAESNSADKLDDILAHSKDLGMNEYQLNELSEMAANRAVEAGLDING